MAQQPAAWTSPPVLGMFAAGIPLLIVFLLVERSAREPILPLDLFSNPVFRRPRRLPCSKHGAAGPGAVFAAVLPGRTACLRQPGRGL